MKTELLGQEKNIVRIKVEFEAGEFEASLGQTVRELSDEVKIPGFRKGRVSRKVLEMRFGRGTLYTKAVEKMLPGAIEQIVGDYDLDAIDAPSLDLSIDAIQEGQPLPCELAFELVPEISLPELEEIEVERPACPEVTDEMIDGTIARLRRVHSTLNPVDRAVGEGDVVSGICAIQILGPDGEAGHSRKPQDEELDLAEPLRSEIRESLLGKRKGDRAEAEWMNEPGPSDEKPAEQKVHYSFMIGEVKERIFPEMGPEFYKTATGSEVESEDGFREELRKRLHENFESDIRNRVVELAVERVVSEAELDVVPDSLVNRQTDSLRSRDISMSEERFGVELDEYLRRAGIQRDNYEQNLREEAAGVVRRVLVLDKIGEEFSVSVEKEELDAELVRLAAIYGTEPAKLKAVFYKDENRLLNMARELRYSKIAQLIAGKVKVKDADINADAGAGETPEAPLPAPSSDSPGPLPAAEAEVLEGAE
jgi:trigger factor